MVANEEKDKAKKGKPPVSYAYSHTCEFTCSVLRSLTDIAFIVAVLDGREKRFSMTKNELSCLKDILPPFESEVPPGSCVLVAYTTNTYMSNKLEEKVQEIFSLSYNLHWVVVL